MNINEFKKNISQKPPMMENRFDVDIFPPNIMKDVWLTEDIKILKIYTKSLNMGGRNLLTNESVMGKIYSVPYGDQYNTISLNLMLDDNYKSRAIFDEWQNRITARNSSVISSFYKDYVTTIQISHKNQENEKRNVYTMIDAFPTVIGDIQLAKDSTNQTATIAATFSYKYWESSINLER